MATILDNIGRGLAIGAQLGAGAKKRYGDLLEQNRRSLENRRFQEGLQRKSQLFQEAESQKQREAVSERFWAKFNRDKANDERDYNLEEDKLKATADFKNQTRDFEGFEIQDDFWKEQLKTNYDLYESESKKLVFTDEDAALQAKRMGDLERNIVELENKRIEARNIIGKKYGFLEVTKTTKQQEQSLKQKQLEARRLRTSVSTNAVKMLADQGIAINQENIREAIRQLNAR